MQARYGVDSMTADCGQPFARSFVLRECQDAYAWRSQQRTTRRAKGWLAEGIHQCSAGASPIVKTNIRLMSHLRSWLNSNRAGSNTPSPQAILRFKRWCALLLASHEAFKLTRLTQPSPRSSAGSGGLLRTGWAWTSASNPQIASQIGLGLDDFDCGEINEAFAAQCSRVRVVSDWPTMPSMSTATAARSRSGIRSAPAVRVW
jgi:hypothetical protein